jgi:hypothetical protein
LSLPLHVSCLKLVGIFLISALLSPQAILPTQQPNRRLERVSIKPSVSKDRRTALVIGNGNYANISLLKNPANDATLVATTLKNLGFEVLVGINKSQREMRQLIRDFGQQLRDTGGVGLFYFAGHGVQSNGNNYLIPVDADIQNEADVEDVGIDLNYVLNTMKIGQSVLNIVILDACRNNPFAQGSRSARSGLASVKAPSGTLIAYATAPDSTAADGDSGNSPYTEELTRQMQAPGLVLETMFRRVTEKVSARTGGRQEPWISDNHKGEFFFKNAVETSGFNNNEPPKIDPIAVEREHWETIRNSTNVEDYKNYLQTYPAGAYVAIARAKISQIESAANARSETSRSDKDSQIESSPGFAALEKELKKSEWHKLNAREQGFSVSMPGETVDESRRSVYHGWILQRQVFRTQLGNRPFFAVITAAGLDNNRSTDAEKLDSYVDAFSRWLAEAAFGKGPQARLKLLGENALNGSSGREYEISVGVLSGIARAYLRGNRFYVAVALDVSRNESLEKQFFDSFVLN